jgi:hypothetical protein
MSSDETISRIVHHLTDRNHKNRRPSTDPWIVSELFTRRVTAIWSKVPDGSGHCVQDTVWPRPGSSVASCCHFPPPISASERVLSSGAARRRRRVVVRSEEGFGMVGRGSMQQVLRPSVVKTRSSKAAWVLCLAVGALVSVPRLAQAGFWIGLNRGCDSVSEWIEMDCSGGTSGAMCCHQVDTFTCGCPDETSGPCPQPPSSACENPTAPAAPPHPPAAATPPPPDPAHPADPANVDKPSPSPSNNPDVPADNQPPQNTPGEGDGQTDCSSDAAVQPESSQGNPVSTRRGDVWTNKVDDVVLDDALLPIRFERWYSQRIGQQQQGE